jgi:hypothetical protein
VQQELDRQTRAMVDDKQMVEAEKEKKMKVTRARAVRVG